MENVWAGKAAVMKKEIVLKNKAILHFDREVQMISYILTMAFSALGFDEVSTRTRRRRDKGYLTFWGRWREFANILIGKEMAHTETKHCATLQYKINTVYNVYRSTLNYGYTVERLWAWQAHNENALRV